MSLRKVAVLSAVFGVLAGASTNPLSAQHEGHPLPAKADTSARKKAPASKPKATSTKKKPAAKPPVSPTPRLDSSAVKKVGGSTMPGVTSGVPLSQDSRKHAGHDMTSGPLSISMERMGSGTTWIPDAVTLPSRHRMLKDWELMLHGFVFAQYDNQSDRRGDDQWGSLNWGMLMASREVGGGHLQARTMLSLDPWTVSSRGYPLLLQSGETFDGKPLHDRQHPHDFLMELAVLYQREITNRVAWSIYAAPSGEPALSPVAFMHRPSAMDNPAAPLSHHWQDATHVSFGVITAGVFSRRWQVETSLFNGREPDESRWNIDPIRLDSYSGRVTYNPDDNWSVSAGAGYLKSPESLHPDESLRRVTASALHGRKLGADGQTASAFIWGMNRHGGAKPTHSFLLENQTIFDARNTVFGRAELVQKTGEDMALDEEPSLVPADLDIEETRFDVGSLQLGFIREVARVRWATVGIGGATTVNFVPASLEAVYGTRRPLGAFLFLRVRPFHLTRSSMPGMKNAGAGSMHGHE